MTSSDPCEGSLTNYGDGSFTYTNSQGSIWEVKAIQYTDGTTGQNDPNFSQSILCGTNYGKPCTSGSWTLSQPVSSSGCMMIQIDYNGGTCNSKDPVFCFN